MSRNARDLNHYNFALTRLLLGFAGFQCPEQEREFRGIDLFSLHSSILSVERKPCMTRYGLDSLAHAGSVF